MSAQKTYYVLDEVILTLDGADSPSVAADRFRTAWAAAADPRNHMPYLRRDFSQTFTKLNAEAECQGRLPQDLSLGPDHGLMGDLPEDLDARIYVLFTVDPDSYHMDADQEEYENDHIEPQLYAMEKRAGEKRIRTIESLSLREFVNSHIDDNDADRALLYRIRTQKHSHDVIHGDDLERILECVDDRSRGRSSTGYQPEFTLDQIDQLERALEHHRQRTATPAARP